MTKKYLKLSIDDFTTNSFRDLHENFKFEKYEAYRLKEYIMTQFRVMELSKIIVDNQIMKSNIRTNNDIENNQRNYFQKASLKLYDRR